MGDGYRFWAEEEDDFLREVWDDMTSAEIATMLGRTKRAVEQRSRNLGLKRHPIPASIDAVHLYRAPCEPTNTVPGSPEKIEVLRSRVANGQELWHPNDPRYFPNDSPNTIYPLSDIMDELEDEGDDAWQ
ncbi:MAG: hypothetical protein CMK32_09795 [Porticoccaceae bacterium]|nr:hypothetical protein [Porticoccaceae bacterium]